MGVGDFPSFVGKLPEADLPYPGWRGWLLQNNSGLVLFNEAFMEVKVPEHVHGNQWGVVISGAIIITTDTETRTYKAGDNYYIPLGTKHQAILKAGFRGMDLYSERNAFHAKSKQQIK